MIIYNKRKTSDAKPFFPYANLAIILLLIGAFVAWNMQGSDSTPTIQEAQVPAAIVETVNLSGEWIGTMTEDYNTEVRYDYRIVLQQNDTSIQGIAYQESSNYEPEIYSESSVLGNANGTSLYFYESRVNVLENISLDSWCLIEVNLNYEIVNGLEMLVGTWDSGEYARAGCETVTGRVVLTRQAE